MLFNQILLTAKGLLTPALKDGFVHLIPGDNLSDDDDPPNAVPLQRVLKLLMEMLSNYLGEKFVLFEEHYKKVSCSVFRVMR